MDGSEMIKRLKCYRLTKKQLASAPAEFGDYVNFGSAAARIDREKFRPNRPARRPAATSTRR
jgi:hypothetical protein